MTWFGIAGLVLGVLVAVIAGLMQVADRRWHRRHDDEG